MRYVEHALLADKCFEMLVFYKLQNVSLSNIFLELISYK
jgi:hypothetical protein